MSWTYIRAVIHAEGTASTYTDQTPYRDEKQAQGNWDYYLSSSQRWFTLGGQAGPVMVRADQIIRITFEEVRGDEN